MVAGPGWIPSIRFHDQLDIVRTVHYCPGGLFYIEGTGGCSVPFDKDTAFDRNPYESTIRNTGIPIIFWLLLNGSPGNLQAWQSNTVQRENEQTHSISENTLWFPGKYLAVRLPGAGCGLCRYCDRSSCHQSAFRKAGICNPQIALFTWSQSFFGIIGLLATVFSKCRFLAVEVFRQAIGPIAPFWRIQIL